MVMLSDDLYIALSCSFKPWPSVLVGYNVAHLGATECISSSQSPKRLCCSSNAWRCSNQPSAKTLSQLILQLACKATTLAFGPTRADALC